MSFDDWIAGFVAGEGCFAMGIYDHTRTLHFNVAIHFTIKLRADDKEEVEENKHWQLP